MADNVRGGVNLCDHLPPLFDVDTFDVDTFDVDTFDVDTNESDLEDIAVIQVGADNST